MSIFTHSPDVCARVRACVRAAKDALLCVTTRFHTRTRQSCKGGLAKQSNIMDTKAPSLETLPEEVLQCVLQHVPFKDRYGSLQRKEALSVDPPLMECLECRAKVAPLVCKKWALALRQASRAWDSVDIDTAEVRLPDKLWSLLAWASCRCSSTTTAKFSTDAKEAEQIVNAMLTKLPAIKQVASLPARLSDRFRVNRNPGTHTIGSFCALQLCSRLKQVYLYIGILQQGHLDCLGSLRELEVVVVKGNGERPSHTTSNQVQNPFPGQLAMLPALRVVHITNLMPGIGELSRGISLLSKLEELHLVHCQVTKLPEELLQLSHLSTLQVSNVEANDGGLELPDLGQLPQLKRLALHNGFLEAPPELISCTQFTSLSLYGVDQQDLPNGPFLCNLRELELADSDLRPCLLKEATHLQRLFCMATDLHWLSDVHVDLVAIADALCHLQQLHINWDVAVLDARSMQRCLQLNQLLACRNGIAAGECVVRIVPEDNWRRHELMLPWASHELLPERFWNGL